MYRYMYVYIYRVKYRNDQHVQFRNVMQPDDWMHPRLFFIGLQ